MAEQTLSTSTFYAQKEFPQQTELRLRSQYEIAAGEQLILALWQGAASRKGFIVTDRMLRWNFTSLEKAEHDTLTVSTEETFPKLIIHSEETDEDTVLILQKMTAPQAQELCDTLTATLADKAVPEAFPQVIKNAPLVTERNILDTAGSFFDSLFGFTAAKETQEEKATPEAAEPAEEAATETHEQDTSRQEEEKTEDSGQKPEATFTARTVILSIIDVIASLAFIAAVLLALKPWLLQNNPSISSADSLNSFLGALESLFLRRGIIRDLPQELRELRNIFVFSLLGSYFLLKLIVLGTSKNGTLKVVSVLLVALIFLCFALLMDKFLIFLLFALVIYFCFELSCGFTAKGTLEKLIVICVITVIAYFVLHCILVEDIQDAFSRIFRELSLPVQHWL